MRLFLLGGTGNTGTQLLDAALARGHDVTAFVRSPHKVTHRHPRLSIVEGAAREIHQLAREMRGHDAVLSALGPTSREALFGGSTLLSDCAAATTGAMALASVSRLVIVSAALLFPEDGLRFRFFQWLLGHHIRDLERMEKVVRSTDLDWTIARPPNLTRRGEASYRAVVEGFPAGGFSMSFRAVAAYVLDSLDEPTHVGHVVGLAGPAS